MENPEYISLKRDVVLSSLIETEEDTVSTEYIDYIKNIIDNGDIKRKDGARLYTISGEDPRNWSIFINDGFVVVNEPIYNYFSRRLLYMSDDQVLDIINTIINIILGEDNEIKKVDPLLREYYYLFFYEDHDPTSTKIKLKMLNCYVTTSN